MKVRKLRAVKRPFRNTKGSLDDQGALPARRLDA
jgi:hypothetical protein